MIVSGRQQRDPAIHMYPFSLKFPSHLGCHITLSRPIWVAEGTFLFWGLRESLKDQSSSLVYKVVNSHQILRLPGKILNCLNWQENIVDTLDYHPLPPSHPHSLQKCQGGQVSLSPADPTTINHTLQDSSELGWMFCLQDPFEYAHPSPN